MKKISEGQVVLNVPDVRSPEEGEVFYNPIQSLSRDFSICVYSALGIGSFCDPLCASGARGIRVAKEVGIPVSCSDANPSACALATENALENGVENLVSIRNVKSNSALSEGVWDCVDIDPFGSPVPFLDDAVRSAKRYVSITATDPAALCGVYPRVTKRKYLSRVVKTDFYHEVGIRILAGYAIRMAARFDISLSPIVCHSSNHYYRIYFRKEKGAKLADCALGKVGHLLWCRKCGTRREKSGGNFSCICPVPEIEEIGPLFSGSLFDKGVCEKAACEAKSRGLSKAESLLSKIIAESSLPPFHYEHHTITSLAKTNPGKLERLLGALRERGFRSERTHFSLTGFRTFADLKTILDCVREEKE